MQRENMRELLTDLALIGQFKSLLPLNQRGLVNILGLFVQERFAGETKTVRAGGKFRSYIEARRSESEDWQLKKFDEVTWNQRFAKLVEPTLDIARFLVVRAGSEGDLAREDWALLATALDSFERSGEWVHLPIDPTAMDDETQSAVEQKILFYTGYKNVEEEREALGMSGLSDLFDGAERDTGGLIMSKDAYVAAQDRLLEHLERLRQDGDAMILSEEYRTLSLFLEIMQLSAEDYSVDSNH